MKTLISDDPLALLLDEVLRMKTRINHVFTGITASVGLTAMEMTVLTAVAEAPTPPTVPQIGRSLGHPRQVISRAANALIKAKLLEAFSNPDHKTAKLLRISEGGAKVYAQATEKAKYVTKQLYAATGSDEYLRVATDLRKLRKGIEEYSRTIK